MLLLSACTCLDCVTDVLWHAVCVKCIFTSSVMYRVSTFFNTHASISSGCRRVCVCVIGVSYAINRQTSLNM